MVEYNREIYKKDTRGNIRVLQIKTYKGELVQTSGLIDGNLVSHSKLCKGKNIGKANETSPTEQAWSQAESKLKEKLRSGYFETKEEAENQIVILPMLAKSFKPEANKIDWSNAWIQPKFDGQRALIFVNNGLVTKIMSRTGKDIETMDHIKNYIESLNIHGKFIFDGELYAHGHTFQENMRMIKKVGDKTHLIKFHCYDMVLNNPFIDRSDFISKCFHDESDCLELVPTFKVTSAENLRLYHEKFVSLGYEGSMVRWGNEAYKVNGRSSNLLKNKDFIDIAIPIKDVIPTDANPLHGQPIFEWEGAKDNKMSAGVKGTHEYREHLLANKEDFIGLVAEVRFFEYYDTGVPRFPVMVGIRNDK